MLECKVHPHKQGNISANIAQFDILNANLHCFFGGLCAMSMERIIYRKFWKKFLTLWHCYQIIRHLVVLLHYINFMRWNTIEMYYHIYKYYKHWSIVHNCGNSQKFAKMLNANIMYTIWNAISCGRQYNVLTFTTMWLNNIGIQSLYISIKIWSSLVGNYWT